VLTGAALRLAWPGDIEYKADEKWTFEHAVAAGKTEPLSWLGMPTSAGVLNPGMSLWVFVLPARFLAIDDPTQLARCVEILSIAAILLLIAFAICCCTGLEREIWLWASALLSVNPLAILFHRKIWPPCILPIFVSIMLIGWWNRRRWWGAFLWGLLSVLMGQIHVAAFFMAGGFTAWALLFDRKRVAWISWISGCLVGSLTMIPWLLYLSKQFSSGASERFNWVHMFESRFWIRWMMEPLGFGLDHTLGDYFVEFLKGPFLGGYPTYLLGLVHLAMAGLGLVIFWRAIARRFQDAKGTQADSATAFTLGAALWGCGLLFTVSTLPITRHYMIVLYPFEMAWLARLALGPVADEARLGRKLLATLCVCQLLVSFSFLRYVHSHHGVPGDEFGLAYSGQVATSATAVRSAVAP
jgi:hypothetical protein